MKKLVLIAIALSTCIGFAAEKKETARKPSSQNIAQMYLDLADALAQARMETKVCENNAYQSEILKLVSSAASVEGFSAKNIGGPTSVQMGAILAFKELNGEFDAGGSDVAGYTRALANTDFNATSSGVLGSRTTLRFQPSGVLSVFIRNYDEDSGESKPETRTGKWNLKFSEDGKGKHGAGIFVSVTYPLKTGKMKTYVYRLVSKYESGRKIWILVTNIYKNAEDSYKNIKYWNEIVDECGD